MTLEGNAEQNQSGEQSASQNQNQSQNSSDSEYAGGSVGQNGNDGKNWREILPEDLRTEKSFEKFKDVASLAKSYLEAQRAASKALNSKGLVIPGENSTPEEWNGYYKAIGRPDTPDGYDLKPPELPDGLQYNEERTKKFADIAHKNGLTNSQLKALHAAWNEEAIAEHEAQIRAIEEFRSNTTITLKKAWGNNYEGNMAQADAAIDMVFGAEFKQMLKDTGLCNHPDLIKGMYKASQTIGEHVMATGGKQTSKGEFSREGLISMKLDPKYAMRDPLYLKQVEAYNKGLAESVGAN